MSGVGFDACRGSSLGACVARHQLQLLLDSLAGFTGSAAAVGVCRLGGGNFGVTYEAIIKQNVRRRGSGGRA